MAARAAQTRPASSAPVRSRWLVVLLLAGGLAGCGNTCGAFSVLSSRCDRLCCDVAETLDGCVDDSLTWEDLGAADADDFARQCSDEWDRTNSNLTAYELQEATGVCRDVRDKIADLDPAAPDTCERVRALYAERP